jgi:hypothetical protein
MGVDLGRVQLVLQIIDGLTDDYRRQIRSSLNCLRELKDMTMEWLTVSLLQEEAFNKRERQIRPSTTGDQQALPAKVGQKVEDGKEARMRVIRASSSLLASQHSTAATATKLATHVRSAGYYMAGPMERQEQKIREAPCRTARSRWLR